MANQDQRDELESVESIYSGSEEVQLELPDLAAAAQGGRVASDLRVAIRIVVECSLRKEVDLVVWLPASYLVGEPADRPPRFELASACLSRPQLHALSGQLDERLAECHGGPILFECVEWLRTESWRFLGSAALAEEDQECDIRVVTWRHDIEATSEDDDEAALATTKTCVNCALEAGLEEPGWSGCGHVMCKQCLGDVVQVHSACGKAPRCPVPECSKPLPEAVVDSAGAPQLWAIVSLRLRGTPFEQSVVYCPRCEDRGMDMPVITASSTSGGNGEICASRLCQCFQCSCQFCDICRSPWHPGQSCFDDESRVVRMTKRRPPLTADLAEVAAKVREEVSQREKKKAEMLKELVKRGSGQFEVLRKDFLETHREAIMHGLNSVLAGDVTLAPASIAREVQSRFMSALFAATNAELRPAFHGTDARNHPSIFRRGLLVPGEESGIRVAHGQAHGRGVYTANVDAAWLSKGFCTQPRMLVCAVLDSGEVVRHVGDAMVVARSDHVVPLFEGASGSFWGECGPSGPFRSVPAPAAAKRPPPAQMAQLSAAAKTTNSNARGKQASAPSKARVQGRDNNKSKFLLHLATRAKRH